MKTIFLSDGPVGQIVLTPENDFEKFLLKQWSGESRRASIASGSFYKCKGGWDRQTTDDNSLIIRLESL